MRRIRTLPVLAAMVLAVTLTSCSGDDGTPVQPEAQPAPTTLIPPGSTMTPEQESQLLLGFLIETVTNTTETLLETTTGLLGSVLACPNYRHYETRQTVGPWGGYIQAGPASLYIPPGALDRYVTITATVPVNSRATVVNFEPEGLRFDRPTALTMSYAHCGLLSRTPKAISYLDDDKNLQILETLPSVDDTWRKRVTGKLDHFSSYAVSERSSTRDRYQY